MPNFLFPFCLKINSEIFNTTSKKKILFYIFLLIISIGHGQSQIDVINEKSFLELRNLYGQSATIEDIEKQIFYGHSLLEKAKNENNEENIIRGYRMLSVSYNDERKLQYADSIIDRTKTNNSKHYPALAYETKGDYYYNIRAYQKALDNYLLFFSYAEKYDQKEQIYRSNYNIGALQRRIGNLEEALKLYQENFSYSQNNKDSIRSTTYLNSISALSNIFSEMQIVDSATYYNRYGLKESTRLENIEYTKYFSINQGINLFNKDNFLAAIDSIEKHITYLENQNDLDRLSVIYYYCGQSYLAIDKEEKAINYFKKVDTTFQKSNTLIPIVRESYEHLINYYKEKNDLENRLVYLNQLIKVDSVLFSNAIYLNKEIIKKYDIPKLEAEKKEVLEEMESQGKIFKNMILLLLILIMVLLIGFVIQYKRRKRYKKRFNDIINTKKPIHTIVKDNDDIIAKELNIPETIVTNVLKQLETFEKNQEFISNKITLNYLAKEFHTNPNYLSRIINHYKKCSFSNYLSALRIDFTVEQFKTDPMYKKYTIKAISSEVGFNNVQSFAKAFYNNKGVNPSYFIRELKKINR